MANTWTLYNITLECWSYCNLIAHPLSLLFVRLFLVLHPFIIGLEIPTNLLGNHSTSETHTVEFPQLRNDRLRLVTNMADYKLT